MTRNTTGLAIACVMGLATPTYAFTPESTDPIKVMIGDWPSMQIHAEILNIILATYGYSIEKVIADDSARYPGFEVGDLHIALET